MLVLIRGAGDLASGIALRLFHAGMQIIMTDLPAPTSIRRTVCFSEAIVHRTTTVEDVTAYFAETPKDALAISAKNAIAVLADPSLNCLSVLRPDALVDAILAKRNLGTHITDAPCVVGVGPGFVPGTDCHCAIETMRGHTLGRVLTDHPPLPNTNIPGLIGGYAGERVLRAPADGVFHLLLPIGSMVKQGDIAGEVNGEPMYCHIDGVLRGILADGTPVCKGMKAGDVDPRGEISYCSQVSDKALAIGGGVLEAILRFTEVLKHG